MVFEIHCLMSYNIDVALCKNETAFFETKFNFMQILLVNLLKMSAICQNYLHILVSFSSL